MISEKAGKGQNEKLSRKDKGLEVLRRLRIAIPEPETELVYRDPYQLVVAVLLSAQCTDKRVNIVTPGFFAVYPTPESLSKASVAEIFPHIKSISFPNNKSKHLLGLGQMLMTDFGGKVPGKINDLVKLPGVGRKTAQVVSSVAFGVAALPVDTHVFRVSNRIGLSKNANTTDKVEKQLKRVLPEETWAEAHHLIILHGRYTCIARAPKCSECNLTDICDYFSKLMRLPLDLSNLEPNKGKFYCKTCRSYTNDPDEVTDRKGVSQISCPKCSSMMMFNSKTGRTLKKVKDYRV